MGIVDAAREHWYTATVRVRCAEGGTLPMFGVAGWPSRPGEPPEQITVMAVEEGRL